MGQLHNELRKGPFGRALKNILGISAQGEGGLERYGETLQPVLDLWRMPEFYQPRGEQLASNSGASGAVAGEFSYAVLQNLAGSRALVVVERVSVLAAVSCVLSLLTDAEVTTAGLVANTTVSRDSRWGAVGRLRFQTGSHTAVLGLGIDRLLAVATETRFFQVGLPVVLSPGFALAIIAETVNSALTNFVMAWRDRPAAFSSELVP